MYKKRKLVITNQYKKNEEHETSDSTGIEPLLKTAESLDDKYKMRAVFESSKEEYDVSKRDLCVNTAVELTCHVKQVLGNGREIVLFWYLSTETWKLIQKLKFRGT